MICRVEPGSGVIEIENYDNTDIEPTGKGGLSSLHLPL